MYYICIYFHYIVLISFLNCILPNSITKLASNFEVDAIKSYFLINLVQDFYKVLNNKGKNFALRGDEVVDIIPLVGCLATHRGVIFWSPRRCGTHRRGKCVIWNWYTKELGELESLYFDLQSKRRTLCSSSYSLLVNI